LSGNEDQVGGFDLICKGKGTKTSTNAYPQKISFLGTMNNRIENIKKLARNNSNKMNEEYS
jgi:tubulin polyglutamylase TTLL9